MTTSIKEYQKKCIDAVLEKIDSGEKHISIIVPAGLGKTGMAISLAKNYLSDNSTLVFVVNKMLDYSQILKMVNSTADLANARVLKLKEYLDDHSEYDYVFLFDLELPERKQVQKQLPKTHSIFLSFSSAFKTSTKKIDNITSVLAVYVYGTKNVLDIRDVRYTDQSEIDYVRKDVECIQTQLKLYIDEEKKKKEELERQNQELNKQIELFDNIKHSRSPRGTGPSTASAIVDESPRLRELVKQNQNSIKLHDMTMEEQETYIQLANYFLGMCGFNITEFYESAKKIQAVKEKVEKLLAQNSDDQELIIKQAQDDVIEIVNSISPASFMQLDEEYYRTNLSDELTEIIWNRLDDSSKRFLITAKVTFDNLQRINDDRLDYSGVCLLVTKAVEVEISKRFLTNYKKHLTRTYKSVSNWPQGVREWKNGKPTNNELLESRFTLGDVKFIIGSPTKVNRDFKQYAKSRLYMLNNDREIGSEIEKAYQFVEKIRVDYRNPSAHKDSVSATSAAECMDYVIDVQRMLKEILQPMRF